MSRPKRRLTEIIGNIVQDIRSEKVYYFDLNKKSDRIGHVFQLVMSKGILTIENPFSALINKKILSSDSLDIFDNADMVFLLIVFGILILVLKLGLSVLQSYII